MHFGEGRLGDGQNVGILRIEVGEQLKLVFVE